MGRGNRLLASGRFLDKRSRTHRCILRCASHLSRVWKGCIESIRGCRRCFRALGKKVHESDLAGSNSTFYSQMNACQPPILWRCRPARTVSQALSAVCVFAAVALHFEENILFSTDRHIHFSCTSRRHFRGGCDDRSAILAKPGSLPCSCLVPEPLMNPQLGAGRRSRTVPNSSSTDAVMLLEHIQLCDSRHGGLCWATAAIVIDGGGKVSQSLPLVHEGPFLCKVVSISRAGR